MLEEGASILSGGQRQRVAIARALLRNAPSSFSTKPHPDNESERFFLHNLDTEFGDRTVFMIAHRLSTVRSAETVSFLTFSFLRLFSANHNSYWVC